MISQFEDFESAVPQSLPDLTSLVLSSGLGLDVHLFPGSPPVAIVRASSEQGEHGFQYLSIGVNESSFNQVFLKLPGTDFTTVEFTLWAEDDVPDLGLSVVFYVDVGLPVQKVYTAPVGSKLLVEYTAPSGGHITTLRLANNTGSEGGIAYDSMRWS